MVTLIFSSCSCCFRCTECRSTLLPGSYKGSDSGALICTHHLTRHASANQNGRSDLSKRPVEGQSARADCSTVVVPSERDQEQTASPVTNTDMPAEGSIKEDSLDEAEEINGSVETQEKPRPSSPPNPFDESDEEDEEGKEEEMQTKPVSNVDLPSTTDILVEEVSRPVPAPRRISERTPPPRPAPRVRLPRTSNGLSVGKLQVQNINLFKYK